MTGFDRAPVPERDLPEHRRAALRALLLEQVAATGTTRARRRSWPTQSLGRTLRGPLRAERSASGAAASEFPRRGARASAAPPARLLRPVAVAAMVALVAVAVQFWPVPANRAFAAWTPAPQPVDQAELARIGDLCIRDLIDGEMLPARGRGARPVLVDRRGDAAVALVVAPDDQVADCTFLGLRGTPADSQSSGSTASYYEQRGARAVTVEEYSAVAYSRDSQGLVTGQVAPGVDRVVVTLDDGTRVQASVRDGWYVAWWPNRVRRILWWWEADWRDPRAVQAYDDAGQLLGRARP